MSLPESNSPLGPLSSEASILTKAPNIIHRRVQNGASQIQISTLRESIPKHCWTPLYRWAFWYTFRDIVFASVTAAAAWYWIPSIQHAFIRFIAWVTYGCVEGMIMTGIWILGHECGHSAFSPSEALNHCAGFFFHSILLTPYFSWRSTHRRHHMYTNNLDKDHNHVPPTRAQYASSLSINVEGIDQLTQDSPFFTLARLIIQQIFGWPWYLATNITAAPGSLVRPRSQQSLGNGHWLPSSALFRPEEARWIVLSNIGVGCTILMLWNMAQLLGWRMVALIYMQPYMWVNNWIIGITYLHHCHPDIPKFEDEAWSYIKGATGTMDRDFGWIGKHVFHSVMEYHVVHHLFPRIPFYHGEEATKALKPLLGDLYHEDRSTTFVWALWDTFTQCQWVEPVDANAEPADKVMMYRGRPTPPFTKTLW